MEGNEMQAMCETIDICNEQIREQQQQIKELKEYTQHSRRCGLDKFGICITENCTCGLDEILNKH